MRESAEKSATNRLWDTLTEYGITDDEANNDPVPFKTVFDERVTVLQGDVSLQSMGLAEEEYM